MRTALLQVALRGLHRRFWIVGAATVTVCATLAAQAAGHVVEARYLSDAERASTLPHVAPAPVPPVAAPSPRNPVLLVERNMFCSDCAGAGDPEPQGEATPASTLPLALIATALGRSPWATLRHTTTGAQGAYGIGDRIPRAGVITHVAATWIDVHNEVAGRVERIKLLTATDGATNAPARITATSTADTPFADRVRKIDDHTYEVDRQLVRDLVGVGTAAGVRIVPVTKGDQLLGIRVMQARPTSVAGAIGLKAGDVIEAIDGTRIESAQQLIDMLARLDDISAVRLEGKRRGAALSLDLRLR